MTENRREEIKQKLNFIIENFVPIEGEEKLTYFGLISRYNASEVNSELIGGDWAMENGIVL